MRMERTSLPSPLPRVDILEIQNTEMLAAAEERPFYGSVSTLAALLASLNQSSNATPRRFMDDNTSLDVNIGDGGSCHMSDVSSLSCQNVTQDDIDSLDCDLNASAGNVVDSSSERSDSPIEFERDEEEDLESSAFSSCLEMELRMRETDPSGILLTTEEDIKDFMNNAETFDTDTVKRQNKRIAEQLETDRLQMVLADKQNADADPWCSADDEDNDFYHYKPPVGLRLNGIIGSYSSLNSSSGSHVTLEFSSSLVKQTIPKIRRSPGLARRVDGPGSQVDFGADDNDINEKCAILDNSSNGITQDVQSSNSMQKKTKQILPVQEICVDSGIGDDMANELRSTDKEETGSVENKELEERVTHNGLDHMNEAKSEHEALLSELVESAKKLTENVLLASSASTKVSDETLTEISLNGSDRAIGDCKAFSLSPEATDCDSADVASVLSEDGKSSVTGMPLVEDGLSSSQCSDTEEIPPRTRMHVSLAEGDVQNKSKFLKQLDDDKQSASTGEVESVVDVVKNGISGKRKGKHVTLAAPEYFKREDFKEISDTNIDITNECGRIIKYVAEECLSDQEEFDKFKKEINKKDAIKEDDAEDKLDENDYQEIDSILTEKEPKKEEVEAAASALDGDGMSVKDEKVDIHELTQSPVNRASQAEKGRPTRSYEGERESFLIEGVLFRARYLGSTQLISEGQPSKAMRMMQAQEAIGRIKEPPVEGDTHPSTLVDLFVSVEKIMVLNTDLQEIMMDHALRTISYIADIGDVLVVMARRGPVGTSPSSESRNPDMAAISQTKICCHVFESDEAQLIAQSISQAFQVAYIEFLKANGINDPDLMKEMDYQDVLSQQEIFGEELFLFSNKDMQKEVIIPKLKGEPLGVVIVESGWGSMVPTVVLANMAPGGSAARCGQLNIGDQIMSINGISLVGLPLSTCQSYIKASRNEILVRLMIVSCTPVVEVLVKRPDIKYQLGFSVQNGVICSLLRGGIAERGGVRVGHRIIEINGQSVVAVPHDKIVTMLASSVGEIHMKTMQTSIYRLLTGQDTPHYI